MTRVTDRERREVAERLRGHVDALYGGGDVWTAIDKALGMPENRKEGVTLRRLADLIDAPRVDVDVKALRHVAYLIERDISRADDFGLVEYKSDRLLKEYVCRIRDAIGDAAEDTHASSSGTTNFDAQMEDCNRWRDKAIQRQQQVNALNKRVAELEGEVGRQKGIRKREQERWREKRRKWLRHIGFQDKLIRRRNAEIDDLRNSNLDLSNRLMSKTSPMFENERLISEVARLTAARSFVSDGIRCVYAKCGGTDNHMSDEKMLDAIRAEVAARLMPEDMEWPRYEDGEKVRFGDNGGYDFKGDGGCIYVGPIDAVMLNADKTFELFEDGNSIGFDNSQRVKRPEPKLLAADGRPVRADDIVWFADPPASKEMRVMGVRDGRARCLLLDGSGVDGFVDASELTHERPDSWERIEELAEELDSVLGGEGVMTVRSDEDGRHVSALVARAKWLAGVE